MGRYADRADAEVIGAAKLVGSADTRQDQRGQHRLGQHLGHRLDPFPIGVRAEAIVEAGAVEAVAMRYLDRIDAGLLERLSDRAHMIDTVHVAHGVHAVPQLHIMDVETVFADVEAHAAALRAWMRCADGQPLSWAPVDLMARVSAQLGRAWPQTRHPSTC